jgi:hypothetical protein
MSKTSETLGLWPLALQFKKRPPQSGMRRTDLGMHHSGHRRMQGLVQDIAGQADPFDQHFLVG